MLLEKERSTPLTCSGRSFVGATVGLAVCFGRQVGVWMMIFRVHKKGRPWRGVFSSRWTGAHDFQISEVHSSSSRPASSDYCYSDDYYNTQKSKEQERW
jgi:hypothetical protein